MKLFLKFKNWSNLFFVIPLFLAINFYLYFYAAVILAITANSVLYHFWDEHRFVSSDYILAYLLISVNLIYCLLGKFTYPYFYIALMFVFFALFFNFRQTHNDLRYNLYHGFWHIFSSLITLFSILTYIK
jgi:hypothetical protein